MLREIKVLAVDDDEMSLEMLSSILASQGVVCSKAANGKEALDILESNPDYDILLLDLQMPVMDGFELLIQCKGNPYLSDIPIIVLASDRHEKIKSLKMGADDFLNKPYDLEEIELRIAKLVKSHRSSQAAKQAKKEFLSIASHELRTPMHQIYGLAELLEREELKLGSKELVDLLKSSTDNLSALITDILNYVQLDHESARSSVEPFSLRNTVQSVIESHRVAANKKGIKILLNIEDDVSDILNGPSFYVSKIFAILIENAIKFSADGDINITIAEKTFENYGSQFFCTVSNYGITIPPEFHEKIFEPFMQVDPSQKRSFEGIGLGLAIAKRMLKLMGGNIIVSSEIESGTVFNFSFNCQLAILD